MSYGIIDTSDIGGLILGFLPRIVRDDIGFGIIDCQ
jgi:hypothetical protein